jgi:methanethiol S-methyltransferase
VIEMMQRILVVTYGLTAYLTFLAVFAYTVGFLANAVVPRGIDEGTVGPVWVAVLVNAGLLGAFAVQHTVMARPAFKRWLTRYIPGSIERSTFVLAASLVLVAVVTLWRPMPESVWVVETEWLRAVLWSIYLLGWVTVVGSTYMINHFDLFGLSQVVARARDREHVPPSFRLTMLYRFVRHPIMVGFLIAFWATPDMSQGRLLFAVLGTGYILVGVRFEENDLRRDLGDDYRRYEAEVPRFVPRLRGGRGRERAAVDDGVPKAQDRA